jgi:uncharacterized protein YeaO (DUF488 family)
MASIEIKRAYKRPTPKDGKRILVDRLWPRGLRKDAASLDLWSKEVAPTSSLRVWFDHRADRFAEFKQRYRDELKSNRAVMEILRQIGRGKATLVYAARDPAVNHAVVLAEFLTEAQRRKPAAKKATTKSSSKRQTMSASRPSSGFAPRQIPVRPHEVAGIRVPLRRYE